MKRLFALIIVVMVFFIFKGVLFAGPFGFEAGMSKEQIETLLGSQLQTTKNKNFYYSTKAPLSHSLIERYLLIIDPVRGLVKIIASGKTIQTTRYGDELKAQYSNIKEALTKNYGNYSNDFDFVRSGSLWKEPEYFMMGLLKRERTLECFWVLKNNPEKVLSIDLEAKALSQEYGFVMVSYEFEGWKEYLKGKKQDEDKTF
jgi:hypothetical protein